MSHMLPKHSYGDNTDTFIDRQRNGATTLTSNHGEEEKKEKEGEVFINPKNGKKYSWQFGRESVIKAIEAVKQGEIVCVTDDCSRENEGDFIMAASLATQEKMAFIIKYSGGVICCAMNEDRLKELELPPMVVNNQDPKQTAFTLTVDTFVNTTTGISAGDRASTFRMLADPSSRPHQFMR
jgi:hypothetical protein